MTGLNILHTDTGENIASLRHFDFGSVVGVHFHHSANPLGLACRRVQDSVALLHLARIDPDKGQSAKTVVHDFECQSAKRLCNINLGHLAGRLAFLVGQWLRINLGWTGQIINNRIENELDTLVLER